MNKTEYDKYWETKGEYGRIRILRKKARKKARAEKVRKSHTCEMCKTSFPNAIEPVINSYYSEMYDRVHMERLCSDCHESSKGDI